MSLLPRRDILAVSTVLSVAVLSRDRPVLAKSVSTNLGLPDRYLESLLQALVHQGILKGFRGRRGGYRLAREPSGITVEDDIQATETTEGKAKPKRSQSPMLNKVVLRILEQARREWAAALAHITMEDLLKATKRLQPEVSVPRS